MARYEYIKGAHCERIRHHLEGDGSVLRDRLFIDNIYTLLYQEKGKGFYFKGERHAFWELTYIDFGCMRTVVDDREYVLDQGQVMLYGPGQYHMQRSIEKAFINFITISFDMKIPCEDEASIKNRVFSVGSGQAEFLKHILRENLVAHPYFETAIINELKRFIISLIRMVILDQHTNHLDSTVKQHMESDVVREVKAFINENLSKNIKLEDVAHHTNVSKQYLSAIFKRHTAMTPVEYMINARLAKGKELIRDGELNISEIAEALGYSSVHYFSRQFKAKLGISPSDYSYSIEH